MILSSHIHQRISKQEANVLLLVEMLSMVIIGMILMVASHIKVGVLIEIQKQNLKLILVEKF